MRLRSLRWLPLLLLASCLCTDEAVYAIELRVEEPGGPTMDPIALRYRVDGGAWVSIPDTAAASGTADICATRTECSLGLELEGSYEIEVTRGPVTARADTRVLADRCHVHPRTVLVPLP